MAVLLTSGKEEMQIMRANKPQSRRPDTEKVRFYDEMTSKWDLVKSNAVILSLGDFNGHVGK